MPSKEYEIKTNETSIILVGKMLPALFHPEWLKSKELISSYVEDKFFCTPERTQIQITSGILLSVELNKLSIYTPKDSEIEIIKDLIINILNILDEFSVEKIGINTSCEVSIPKTKYWKKFGSKLAPNKEWIENIDYLENDEETKEVIGLWTLTMHLPRPDKHIGFIHPTINTMLPFEKRMIKFGINNHIEIEDKTAKSAIEVIESSYRNNIEINNNVIEKIMFSQIYS